MSIITVTSDSDTPVKGELTLRQAVAKAKNGDTIEFSKSVLQEGDVFLTKNLVIAKSITIDGRFSASSGLGGNEGIYADNASVEVAAGAHVTLAYTEITNLATVSKSRKNGPNGENALPGQDGDPATDGGLGGNGGGPVSNGANGAPALINKGALTLDHVEVSGDSTGGKGGAGGKGGKGGVGGDDTSLGQDEIGGHGGKGGNGGIGGNGGRDVGGILNEGILVMKDSAVEDCTGNGGAGGAGGDGADGGAGGSGAPGGRGGKGGFGGDGGVGGLAVGGILNEGKITFEGANVFFGDTGVGGAAGAAGAGGSGGGGGTAENSDDEDGLPGDTGGNGKAGTKGPGVGNIYEQGGSVSGTYGKKDFFEFMGPTFVGAHTIGNSKLVSESFAEFGATVLMDGLDTISGSVGWKVVPIGDDLTKSDFAGGVMSGVVHFTGGHIDGDLSFSFANSFIPKKRESFKIELYSPSSGDLLGSDDVLTETLIPIISGNQTINGTNGNDDIACGPGNDVVNGMGGDDNIECGSGRDTINCDSGDDQVTAGAGVDTFVAGSGRDSFTFYFEGSKPSAPDTIKGFSHALGDTIDIGVATKFIGTKAFDGLAAEIRAVENSATHSTLVYYAAEGQKTASVEIIVKGLHAFVASDFGLA